MEYAHNGVICKNCHATIDLTEIGAKGIKRRNRLVHKGLLGAGTYETGDFFDLKCPKCNSTETYSHKEIEPLSDWKGLEERIGKLEARFDDPHFHSDVAKAILEMVAKREAEAESKRAPPKNPLSG